MESEGPDEWIKYLRDLFNAAPSPRELLKVGGELWYYRRCESVPEYAVPAFRLALRSMWPDSDKHTVVAIDLPSVVYAAWFVSQDNVDTPLSILRSIHRQTSPGSFIITTDCRSGVAKRKSSAAYKADRDAKPPEFYEMFNKVISHLKDSGVQFEEHDGMESDDVMASIAFRAQLAKQPCILVTEDKDLWQSLGPNTSIFSARQKEYRNNEWLMAKHRITPKQVVDWLSIVGGKNNIPGVYGVGDAVASGWLEAYKDAHGIYEHRDQLSKKRGEAFVEFYENNYWEASEMHTLSRTVDVGWGPG